MSYTLDIPNAPNNPSQDQPLMKANTNAIYTLIAKDHVTFGFGASSGHHTVIHQTVQSLDPVTIAGVNQVYAKNVTPNATITSTDTQLFTKTGSGVISQLTGRLDGAEGYVWVGGILYQWGNADFPSSGITFKTRVTGGIDFPNNIFSVYLTFKNTSGSAVNATIGVRNPLTTGFTVSTTGASASWTGYYWLAIGN